jgi:hypothetical protein
MVGYKQEKGQDPILCAEERQAATDTIKASRPPNAMDIQAASTTSSLPQWIQNDRKVLRFYGYFQEQVNEDPSANTRVRKVVFLYYLEDDTMQISEPRQDNSGLPQVWYQADGLSACCCAFCHASPNVQASFAGDSVETSQGVHHRPIHRLQDTCNSRLHGQRALLECLRWVQ